MKRRKFIALGLIAGAGVVLAGIFGKGGIRSVGKRIYDWTKPAFQIPSASGSVSVEAVLNSRCTSDWDGDPYKFHWGMFDPKKRLTNEIVEKVITLARVPRLTDKETTIREDSATLSFLVPNDRDDNTRSRLMVKSGMQQQAVGLACAALGVGMVFDNRGKDGTPISDIEIETTRIKLAPMKPGYKGAFWTSAFPRNDSPWLPGDLADPRRDGETPFLSVPPKLEIERKASGNATEASLSQLLWAARGRTPHFYLSKPWGMTIPTWAGRQSISSLYVIKEAKSYRYLNWLENRPTHSLETLGEIKNGLSGNIGDFLESKTGLIIIGVNEPTNRALWEVGYQLFNLLAQAYSLGVSFKTLFLDEEQRAAISGAGIENSVVAFAHS